MVPCARPKVDAPDPIILHDPYPAPTYHPFRSNAKASEELGIKRQSYSAHHKSHIGKVMAHFTVGFLFTGSPERGGKGFLIGCNRCAGWKVPLRDVRHSSKDPVTNRITFRGNPIKHHRGAPYLVDYNVPGSNPGAPSSPLIPSAITMGA